MGGWSTHDVAEHYKRQGSKSPVADSCGSGSRHKYGVSAPEDRTADGITFDSKAEMRAYLTLIVQQRAGMVCNLTLQPEFLLHEAFRDTEGKWHRKIAYRPDFTFLRLENNCWVSVAVDVKGLRTQAYQIKAKLFLAKYGACWKFEEWQ